MLDDVILTLVTDQQSTPPVLFACLVHQFPSSMRVCPRKLALLILPALSKHLNRRESHANSRAKSFHCQHYSSTPSCHSHLIKSMEWNGNRVTVRFSRCLDGMPIEGQRFSLLHNCDLESIQIAKKLLLIWISCYLIYFSRRTFEIHSRLRLHDSVELN